MTVTTFIISVILLKFSVQRGKLVLILNKFNAIINHHLNLETIITKIFFIQTTSLVLILFILSIEIYYQRNESILYLAMFFVLNFLSEGMVNSIMIQLLFMLEIIKFSVKFVHYEMIKILKNKTTPAAVKLVDESILSLRFQELMNLYSSTSYLNRQLSNYYSLQLLSCILIIFNFSLSLSTFVQRTLSYRFDETYFCELIIWTSALLLITVQASATSIEVF